MAATTFPISKYLKKIKEEVPSWFSHVVATEPRDEFAIACALLDTWQSMPRKTTALIKSFGEDIRKDHPRPSELSDIPEYHNMVGKTELRLLMETSELLSLEIARAYGMTLETAKKIVATKMFSPE